MSALAVLLVSGVGLGVLSAVTAAPPEAPVPDRDGYFTRWQALHGGYDPRQSPWVRGWLTVAFVLARPLARRGVRPDVLTVWTVWVACAVLVAVLAGGRWPILGGWLLVASGLGDALDGAVAALTDRATAWGYVLDSAVDRVNDVVYVMAVWALGAPTWLAVATGAAFGLLEYVRARAANAGGGEIGVVTVGERANRVIFCAAAIHFAGVFPEHAALSATIGLAGLAVLSVVGLGQITLAARRRLSGRAA